MAAYLLRRLALSLLTVGLVTAALYAAIRSLPGAPSSDMESIIPAAHSQYHRDDAWPVGYARWLADVVHGDLGVSVSVQPDSSVATMIRNALPCTALLGMMAIGLTLLLALPASAAVAMRPGSRMDRAGAWILYALHALPAFWIALALQQTIAGRLRLLPLLGTGPIGDLSGAASFAPAHFVLPVVALTLGGLAFVIRFCRVQIVAGMRSIWGLASRARGSTPGRLAFGAALANASVPVISLMGLMLPGLVSGSILVESIYALPGIGRLFLQGAIRRDYPLIMGIALMTALATILANLLADLVYRLADPRVTLSDAAVKMPGRTEM